MDIRSLESIGLSSPQAAAYNYVIQHELTKPATLARELLLTRTNAYKILDSLVELKLVRKNNDSKTLTYSAENPAALANLTARYRAEAVAREETVNNIMQDLLKKFSQHTKRPGVEVFVGKNDVISAFRKQANLREDVSFIHTKADVPMMGFDTMHELRMRPSRHNNQRRAIMTMPDNNVINHASHKNSRLSVTWIKAGQYSEPVEWSVTDSSLLIATYVHEPQAVLIMDPIVASAFKQLWKLLDQNLEKVTI